MIYITFKNKFVPAFLAFLRIVIGWHFLYEGMIKLLDPNWSARSFLEGSRWIFGDIFRWMASGETGLTIINNANSIGLTLIGIALILGLFTRFASWSGAGMLLMYYLAYPPFGGYSYGALAEGNYLIVNKNLIELFALVALALTQSGDFFGLDIIRHRKKSRVVTSDPIISNEKIVHEKNSRRELLKGLAGIPFLAGFAGAFFRNMTKEGPDAISGATSIRVEFKSLSQLKGKMPVGKLGDNQNDNGL
jgi:thiosulfate dehydrogenase [quinone] large subunit